MHQSPTGGTGLKMADSPAVVLPVPAKVAASVTYSTITSTFTCSAGTYNPTAARCHVAYAPAEQQCITLFTCTRPDEKPEHTHRQPRSCRRASPDHGSGGLYERPQDRKGFMVRLVTSCITGSSPRTPSAATLLRSLSETASSLRIQGLPHLGHHLKLTRHVSYVCGAVVYGIQHRIPQCEEDKLEALQSLQRIYHNCSCWAFP